MRACVRACVRACARARARARVCVCVCIGFVEGIKYHVCVCVLFLRFNVHSFVDLIKRLVFTLVSETQRYRNDGCYDCCSLR